MDVLRRNELDTVAKCESDIPIVLQSFEFDVLERLAELTDLPLTYLIVAKPDEKVDWVAVSKLVHAVGPHSFYVMNPDALTKPVYLFDKVSFKPSNFVRHMHDLGLAVHPWTLKNDRLVFKKTAAAEHQLFVEKGVDGVFTEFPHSTLVLFEHFGSKADFPPALVPSADQF